jgi:hypothetical protein
MPATKFISIPVPTDEGDSEELVFIKASDPGED